MNSASDAHEEFQRLQAAYEALQATCAPGAPLTSRQRRSPPTAIKPPHQRIEMGQRLLKNRCCKSANVCDKFGVAQFGLRIARLSLRWAEREVLERPYGLRQMLVPSTDEQKEEHIG
eukprot:4367366-Amphidinium_carterae.1